MSKTLSLLLGLALVWLVAWAIAGYFMRQAGSDMLAQAEYVGTPATRLERGADIRVEGRIGEGPSVVAPLSEVPCLAAITSISVVSRYRDIHDRETMDSSHVATRRVGPANIDIVVGETHIELPLERWAPRRYATHQSMAELPARLGVPAEAIAGAKESLQGSFTGFSVNESTIDAGTRVFVVGRLEDGDGPLRLAADRVLERVEVYPGSQDEFVAEVRGSGGGLRLAGLIVGAGVGPLPLAILGLVVLVSRRKAQAASRA